MRCTILITKNTLVNYASLLFGYDCSGLPYAIRCWCCSLPFFHDYYCYALLCASVESSVSLSLSPFMPSQRATRSMRNMRNLRLKIIVYRIEIHNHPKRITLSKCLNGEEEEASLKKECMPYFDKRLLTLICDYVRVSRSNIVQCLSNNLEKRLNVVAFFSSSLFLLSLLLFLSTSLQSA